MKRHPHPLTSRLLVTAVALAMPALALAGTTQGTNDNNANSNNAQASNDSHLALRGPRTTQSSSERQADRNALWNRLDTNHDGQISRAEFDANYDSAMMDQNNSLQASSASGYLSGEMRASNLIGATVQNRQGQDLGEIKDLIVDVNTGDVRNAIVSFGSTLGVGDKLFRYPLSSFSRARNSDALVLDVDKQSLRSAKGFDRDHWVESKSQNVWQASRLIGKDVADRNGDHLGEIKDLAIDPRSDKIDYAVLKYDRPWSLDNPLVAIQLDSFNFGDGRHDISMNIDRNQIDAQTSAQPRVSWNAPAGSVVTERWVFLFPDNA